jgi:cytochrome d ubiquinol oxidase subunit II
VVSNPDFGNSLTVSNAASAHYTLAVMSVVALIVTPVVLLYQGWTYRVFWHRLGGDEPLADEAPALRTQPQG